MMRAATNRKARVRRHRRVRRKIMGTPERPRLAVYRSNRHIYAQLVDDLGGRTLAAASDLSVQGSEEKSARAKKVGLDLAVRAKEAGIGRAVFDRGGRLYHGRVKAVADGAREGGLSI
jgi:large subunit ribosomal protein L18